MQQLSSLDAELVSVESATTTSHGGALLILDPSTALDGRVTLDRLRDVLEPRMSLAPLLRRRLVKAPLGLGRPHMVDDPDFDIEFHLRELALPTPGDEQQLAEQVARIHARPLDRSRPLWELYLVHGLDGGRQAIYTKAHSAAIDDVFGAEVLSTLTDATVEPRMEQPGEVWQPAPVPGQLDLLARELASMATQPMEVARSLPRALPHFADLPGVASLPGAKTLAQVAASLVQSAVSRSEGVGMRSLVTPATRLSRSITAHRRFAFGSLQLDRVQRIEDAYNVTVDDVALALCTSALRRWLLDHDALPETPLVVAMPVIVSAGDDSGGVAEATGSRLSIALVELPTQLAHPEQRLVAVQAARAEAMAEVTVQFEAVLPAPSQDVTAAVATRSVGLATRAALSLAVPGGVAVNLVISHVSGPAKSMYVAGATVLGLYPASAITDVSGALSITLFSGNGSVDVGLIACRELVPDLGNLVDHLGDALDEIEALIDQEPSPPSA
ncbi:MAG: wax ester/triacylglycerol synthase family O-acyltransferase [Propionibacteriales bacterium]|nr:wax ester/triacylglycerol synthase family O-acyltransferase [Propionibacteriales bacterium]